MPCYRPVTAFKPLQGGALSFTEVKDSREIQIKCGRCIGCRIERRDMWAFRCYAESKLHSHNHFITLTYDDDHYPMHGSLQYRDYQLFAKRLRRKLGPFRFFMCGEYGENFGRPHFHALLFGLDIPDLVKSNSLYASHDLYASAIIESAWGKGFHSIGELTYASARYCATYATKVINGEKAVDHYTRVDRFTGELVQLTPEFGRMSLRPGIGAEWFRRYWPEVATHGAVHVNQRRLPVPKYFSQMLEVINPDALEAMKHSNYEKAQAFIDNTTRDRLEVRESCAIAKSKFNKERYPNAL